MTNYPGILDRIKAVTADSMVIITLVYSASLVFASFEHVPEKARIIAFVFIFFFYDPLFTSMLGGTIGHRLFGIRVKREADEQKNIILPLAIVRYLLKILLGWLSLLTISTNPKRQALHDLIAGSVIVFARKK